MCQCSIPVADTVTPVEQHHLIACPGSRHGPESFHMHACLDVISLLEVLCPTIGFTCYRNVKSNLWISHGMKRMLRGISIPECESTGVSQID